jgi:hypothetical protein
MNHEPRSNASAPLFIARQLQILMEKWLKQRPHTIAV